MPAPKVQYLPARYTQVLDRTEDSRPSGRRELLLRQLTGGTGNHADYVRAAGGHRRRA